MHRAVDNNNFSLWCLLNVLGGQAGALIGQEKTSINLFLEKDNLWGKTNVLTKFWIKHVQKQYGETALFDAIELNDFSLTEMLV